METDKTHPEYWADAIERDILEPDKITTHLGHLRQTLRPDPLLPLLLEAREALVELIELAESSANTDSPHPARETLTHIDEALTQAQARPALVELPTTAEERREIAGILGVPEDQVHKLDLVPAIPGCPFCGAAPSQINGISLVDPETEYFLCPNGHTGRLSRGEWCARHALAPAAQGRERR